jgi:PAS domain S-box-containing protein
MKKILIVDDEQDTRDVLDILFNKDYEVMMASTGKDCLKIFADETPDVVLLDVMMPDIPGTDCLKEIKSISQDTIVIMITAHMNHEAAVQALRFGADDYIMKPFNNLHLKKVVDDRVQAKSLERRVKDLKEKEIYEAILESIGDGILLLDTDLTIINANRSFLKDMGYGLEEVVGKPCYLVTHNIESPCQPPHDTCPIEEVRRTGQSSVEVHVHKDKNGDNRYVEVSAYPLKDETGKVYQFVHVTKDVTENRILQEKVEEHAKGLEQRVSERTRELKESKDAVLNMLEDIEDSHGALQGAYENLKELDLLKDEFLQNVTHELKTPITIVLGSLEILDDEDLSKEGKDLLEISQRNLWRLSRLVTDIMEFSKIEAGTKDLAPVPVQASELLEDVISELQVMAENIDVTIEMKVDEDIQLLADRDGISRVIYNLLSNAIKFNKKGGHIKVTAQNERGNVKFSVKDTGIGIPTEKMKHLFDRFYQVDGTTQRRYAGTGLGLSIVKSIVDMHGGSVWVDSKVNNGSCFHIALPKGVD